jgi:hypothetical protein
MSTDKPRLLDDLPPIEPAPYNAIAPTTLDEKTHPVQVVCPYCQANLSRSSVGRYVDSPAGRFVEIFHPVVCLECNHPLLYLREPDKVVRAHGKVT